MKEILKEVINSIRRHKSRSILTGFGIAWGMFILIVLLGVGNGFRLGVLNIFHGYATNSIWISGQWTTIPSEGGMLSGTKVVFSEPTILKLKNKFPEIISITSEMKPDNINKVSYNGIVSNFEIKGVDHNYNMIKQLELEDGRFLNHIDYKMKRRVAIIGSWVKQVLFQDENPVGKQISIEGVSFIVIGILNTRTMFSAIESRNIYIPNTTLHNTFNSEQNFSTIGFLLDNTISLDVFEYKLRNVLSKEIGFNREDKTAIYINNIQLQVEAFNNLFDGINIFLWILGICFIISGVIGITNIMLVTIKERTFEIGIRKAIGATPKSIVILVLSESLINTVFFGIIGLVLGYVGIGIYNWFIFTIQTGNQLAFSEASIEWYVVTISLILLVVSGLIAGTFPAKQASQIMPIETLNRVL